MPSEECIYKAADIQQLVWRQQSGQSLKNFGVIIESSC